MEQLYTRLFVDTTVTKPGLVALVAQLCDGTVQGGTVLSGSVEIDIRSNELRGGEKVGDGDEFLDFPYTAEIVSTRPGAGLTSYLEFVGALMRSLHAGGASVVAACPWEHLLPGAGRLLKVGSEL